MKNFLIGLGILIVGLITGLVFGFMYTNLLAFQNLGSLQAQNMISNQITESIDSTGGLPINYKGEDILLTISENE